MNRLRELRRAAGMSQAVVAKRAGCTEQAIYYIERGLRTPRLDLARRIAQAVGASIEEVFPVEDSERRASGE